MTVYQYNPTAATHCIGPFDLDEKCYIYGASAEHVENCEGNGIICQESGCPNTPSYNGKVCHFADGTKDCWRHDQCDSKNGRWDASNKRCVQCDANGMINHVLAYTNKKCWDYYTEAWPDCSLKWDQKACAGDDRGKCEAACDADPECDGAIPDAEICPGCKIWERGDINRDKTVNILDIATVAIAFGTREGDPDWNEMADLDGNDEINILDIAMVAINFGKSI